LKRRKSSAKAPRQNQRWIAEIVPTPSSPKEFPTSDANAVEIDKWLRLVDSYWERSPQRDSMTLVRRWNRSSLAKQCSFIAILPRSASRILSVMDLTTLRGALRRNTVPLDCAKIFFAMSTLQRGHCSKMDAVMAKTAIAKATGKASTRMFS